MAPGLTTELPLQQQIPDDDGGVQFKQQSYPKPLKLSGVLEGFAYEDVTPLIGREFPKVNIVDDLLNASNADELLRDVAITISQRGVVFFRAQNNLTEELQKQFVHRLGQLTGKPATSTLHIHPILNGKSEFGVADNEISTISSDARKLIRQSEQPLKRRYDSATWHSDIQFEPCPADYTSLRLTTLPADGGGDTLWASGYEIYDRFSRPYQKFLEGLTATFVGETFLRLAALNPERVQLHDGPRGSPLNVGNELKTVHPVVRTNPVTGWKSIFAIGNFPQKINELDPEESRELLDKFYRIILDNHDLTMRFKWRNENDIAIWDNRSVFHSATFDYQGLRYGLRAVGIAERPYLDPNSKSRTEDLAAQQDAQRV